MNLRFAKHGVDLRFERLTPGRYVHTGQLTRAVWAAVVLQAPGIHTWPPGPSFTAALGKLFAPFRFSLEEGRLHAELPSCRDGELPVVQ